MSFLSDQAIKDMMTPVGERPLNSSNNLLVQPKAWFGLEQGKWSNKIAVS